MFANKSPNDAYDKCFKSRTAVERNFGSQFEELQFKAFIAGGGTGTYIEMSESEGGANYRGVYLKIDSLPNGPTGPFKFLKDADSILILQELIASGIPVLLYAKATILDGAVFSKGSKFNSSVAEKLGEPIIAEKPILMITQYLDYPRLVHEHLHLKDQTRGFREKLISDLKEFESSNPLAAKSVFEFILEQRGYFAELRSLEWSIKLGQHIQSVDMPLPVRRTQTRQEFDHYYIKPVEGELDKIKGDPKLYSLLKEIMARYILSDPNLPDFSLEVFFPNHF